MRNESLVLLLILGARRFHAFPHPLKPWVDLLTSETFPSSSHRSLSGVVNKFYEELSLGTQRFHSFRFSISPFSTSTNSSSRPPPSSSDADPSDASCNLTPSHPVSWKLGSSSNPIAVAARNAAMAEGSSASATEDKPLSLWPGMYHSPVTAALWQARSTIVERTWENSQDRPAQAKLLNRTPEQSRTRVLYSFSSDPILREQYRNPWNGCRIGKLLEDLDALAGTIAMKHCADDDSTTRPLLLVTASVDKISIKKPLHLDLDLKIAGAVAWVGRSSMEIRMEVVQPVREVMDKADVALIANFTFVARDSQTKKAAPVNQLVPATEEEKLLYEEGEARDAQRKRHRKKQQQELIDGAKAHQNSERMKKILAEGRVLCEMPALADRNSILIKDTRLENAIICQPQQRNMHGRIFGGFLMRRAYELAYSTCYVFGGVRPLFLEVDHVDFRRPVDVGDLLRFKSCVLYTETERTEQPLIHVEVVAHVTQPELRSSEVSNTFYFTFSLDPAFVKVGTLNVRRVLPATEEEGHGYLARYDADHLVNSCLLTH